MKKFTVTSMIVAFVSLYSMGFSNAQTIINVQLGYGNSNLYSGSSAADSGTTWNFFTTYYAFNLTGQALDTDSQGNDISSEGVTMDFQSNYAYDVGAQYGISLFDSFAVNDSGYYSNLPFAFHGLQPGEEFSLYIYTGPNNGIFALTDDGTLTSPEVFRTTPTTYNTFIQDTTDGLQGATQAANYVVYTGTADANGTIAGIYQTAPGECDINGFTLVLEPTVPEPSTWAMMLGGMSFLLLANVARKRSAILFDKLP